MATRIAAPRATAQPQPQNPIQAYLDGPDGEFEIILFVFFWFVLVLLAEAAFHGWIIYREHNAFHHPACRRHDQEHRLEDGLAAGEELGEVTPLLARDLSTDYSSCPPPSTSDMIVDGYEADQEGEDDNADETSNDGDEDGDHYYNGEAYIYMSDIFGPNRKSPDELPDYVKSLPRRS
ncbi:hypothetical protein PG984_009001 [Apiospora sp. TS-2023a]